MDAKKPVRLQWWKQWNLIRRRFVNRYCWLQPHPVIRDFFFFLPAEWHCRTRVFYPCNAKHISFWSSFVECFDYESIVRKKKEKKIYRFQVLSSIIHAIMKIIFSLESFEIARITRNINIYIVIFFPLQFPKLVRSSMDLSMKIYKFRFDYYIIIVTRIPCKSII